MKEYNISLVVFTWLTQASVGLIILRAIYIRMQSAKNIPGRANQILLTAFILLVTGLLFSFAHLSYPRHAYNAVNNLASSWMSREILAETVLLATLLLWYFIARFRLIKIPQVIPELVAVITGIALVFFMIKTYMLPSIPELNQPGLPVSFIITPFLAGSVIIFFLIRKTDPDIALKFKMLATLMFIASLINFLIFSINQNDLPVLNLYYACWSAAAIALIPSLNATLKNKNIIPDVIFLNLALICDLLGRVYTLTYTNPGL